MPCSDTSRIPAAVESAKQNSIDLWGRPLVRFLIRRIGKKYSLAFYADELASFDSLCRQNVINHAAVCAGCHFFPLYLLRRGEVEFHKRKEGSVGFEQDQNISSKGSVSDGPASNVRYDVRECMGAFFCDEGRTPCRCHGFPCDSVILRRKPDYVNFWEDFLNASGCFNPTKVRHLHIHHDDLGNEMQGHLDRGVPIGSLPYDFESRELAEQFTKGLPNGWKIICHHNSNRFRYDHNVQPCVRF